MRVIPARSVPRISAAGFADADAELAARRGVYTVTTLSGAESLSPTGPDSITRRHLDSLAVLNLRMLHKHGAPIAIGSDSYRTTSLPEALYLNSLAALPRAELLRDWTEVTAHTIFPKRRIGRLAPDYEASFLVLEGDPLADFANVRRIRLRVKQGKLITVLPAP